MAVGSPDSPLAKESVWKVTFLDSVKFMAKTG